MVTGLTYNYKVQIHSGCAQTCLNFELFKKKAASDPFQTPTTSTLVCWRHWGRLCLHRGNSLLCWRGGNRLRYWRQRHLDFAFKLPSSWVTCVAISSAHLFFDLLQFSLTWQEGRPVDVLHSPDGADRKSNPVRFSALHGMLLFWKVSEVRCSKKSKCTSENSHLESIEGFHHMNRWQ